MNYHFFDICNILMVFLHTRPLNKLKSVGLTQTLGKEWGCSGVCKIISNRLVMELDQNCQSNFAVIHIRAQEIDFSQIL